jgi:hypothetical protein
MICKTCGTSVSSLHGVCIACGSTEVIADPTEVAKDTMKTASNDAIKALKFLVHDPAGNLGAVLSSLGEERSRWVGILFGAFFALCGACACEADIFGYRMNAVSGFLGTAATFGVLSGGVKLCRHFYKLAGHLGRDFFVSGTALLPAGCGLLLCAIVGALSPQFLVFFLVAGFSLSTLMLQTGLVSVCGLSERNAKLVAPLMLGLAALGAALFY